MLLRLVVSEWRAGWRRMLETKAQSVKANPEVKNLFLRKIKEYEAKIAGKADDALLDVTPEVQRSLDDQLQRLASKYRLESPESIKELPVKQMETPNIESAVSVLFEGKTLDDMQKAAKEETEQYIEMRRKKKAEEEAYLAQLQAATKQKQSSPSPDKK
ncbi:unnamed protein product [Gongylonema pulchrum]|uniref:ATP synthase-coupling factor 6, mitochondrial n=1 Tax=Gongylonema pulchrum TaxID=637853 RepID=A0A183D350_9BILA|nr:unnamed protein product [Gongylonema pulchrum]